MELSNKIAIVTGGAQGLGQAFAESMLKKGATVCICDVNRAAGESTAKRWRETYGQNRAVFLLCDVTSHEQFEAVFKQLVNRFGAVDILVNNAGVGHEDDETWRRTIQINLIGVIEGTKLAAKYMNTNNGGRGGIVINISSTAGLTPMFYMPVYAASKHGVVGFTRSCASDPFRKNTGISYACLCPAYTNTELFLQHNNDGIEALRKYRPYIDKYVSNTGVNSVESVANAFDQLLSDPQNNGVVMSVSVSKGIEYIHGKSRSSSKL